MADKLYKKVYFLHLQCIAYWDDFGGPGDLEERTVWEEKRGPFSDSSLAEIEWKRFYEEVNKTDIHERFELRKKYLKGVKISKDDWDGVTRNYEPSDFGFKHYIKEEFEKIK